MSVKSDPRLNASLKFFSQAASLAIILLGGLVLLGWAFDIAALKSILPGLATMKPNTALSFVMAGASLWLLQGEPSLLKRRLALAGAISVTVLALLTLSQDLFGWNLGLDQLLFRDMLPAGSMAPPGRMSPATAFNFSLIGGALLLLDVKRGRERWLAQILLLLAGIVALLALVGYVYGIQSLYRLSPFSSMALHTALTFFVLSLASLAARPERGIIAAIIADTASGLMLRRLLPAALVLPIVIGWIRLQGQRAGLYDTEVGLAIFALANIAVFTGLIWWTARLLQRTDAERKQAEEQFRLVVEGSPNAMILVSAAGQIHLVNAQTEALFGYTQAELLGQPVEMLVPPQFRAYHDRYRDTFFAAPAARPMGAGRDLFGLRKDGSQVPIEIGLNPITTSAGSFVLASVIDITERKQAEEALKKSEVSLAKAQQIAHLGSWELDLVNLDEVDSNNLRWSDEVYRIFGYNPGEIEPSNELFFGTVPADEVPLIQQGVAQAIAEKKTFSMDHRIVLPDGTERIVHEYGDVICDELTGRPLRLFGIIQDITERKQAEEALRESEEQTRLIVESALDAVVTINTDSTLTGWNTQAEAIFGWSRQEALGQSIDIILPPQYREAHHRGLKYFLATGEGPVLNQRIEISARHRDGHEFPVELAISAVRLGDSFIFSAFIRDITERKQAEEQFRLVVEASPNAIILVNSSGDIHLVNARAETLFGYTRQELLRQPVEMLVPPEVRVHHDRYRASFFAAPVVRAMGVGRDLYGLRKDGSQVPVEIGLNPMTSSAGRFVLASIIDITERKRAEEGLRQTMAELARSNAELEQFAYVASHDLQEPLRAVASTIQLLQKRYTGRLDDRADEFIKHAVEGATRMQTLIHDLLAFSQVGTQGQPAQPTDSTAALTRALANLAVVIRESGAVISHDPLPTVKADAGQLVQLFQNLIGNAIKFRSDKAPAIHIGAERQKGDWLFIVRDNGIGIEAQYFERIFVVFQRLHTRREYQGTGIGLAICKKIVDRHGGRIWVESEAGQGSSFYFTLPAGRRQTDDSHQ
jgi:PAS domain S-box-containing protein